LDEKLEVAQETQTCGL